jgi:hypothetical protein
VSTKEPTSRAGILAAGLVRITRTPAELEAAGAWWSAETHADRHDPAAKRARSEGLRPGLPHWLRPPVAPGDAVARMFREADSERRTASEYVGGRRAVVVSEMTPTQLRAALGVQLRRLSGQWGDDKTLDVTVEAPDSAAVLLEAQASPAPTKVRKARTPVPRRPKRPEAAPEPAAVSSAPVTTPTPQRSTRPGKRDRLAWVPVMQHLATLYASRGLLASERHG